ncbi:MAG: ArsR/SmtB family transcription factor [Nostoc sp. DedVER02]|uniref:ArsR/SmtB family transcription factor n=1 Tax=unclassified Nostoc TaxID=2593658 RepID=UPI002AD3E088|nr:MULTISPECIES: metalloregulator ArsR/SmtB family transcription factor [unclassified Nostoc]MDZ7989655.1 metalloregulator ArsR/SmtB family transcription factor [Nostoc sp. DedVER02]MDZ8113391.1 metalloregulator ArsR/SmtB family transcription factor [Nostoc sp. DedVER01b]
MNSLTSTSTCCLFLLQEVLQPDEAAQIAALFRVLGESARLQLLSFIAVQPAQEACVCQLVEPLGLSQPTVSHHLKVLYEAGLLQKERRGTWIYYRLVPERFEILQKVLTLPKSKRD